MWGQTDWSKVPRFWDRDDYYEHGDNLAVASFTVSDTLMTPHPALSQKAADAWRTEVKKAAELIQLCGQFYPDKPDCSIEGFGFVPGPFDMALDYDAKEREFVFTVSSTLTDDSAEYRIPSRTVTRMANDYREDFLVNSLMMQNTGKQPDINVLTALDRLRKGRHIEAAGIVHDDMRKAGLAPRDTDVSKAMFTVFQGVAKMTNSVAAGMSDFYERMAPEPSSAPKPGRQP